MRIYYVKDTLLLIQRLARSFATDKKKHLSTLLQEHKNSILHCTALLHSLKTPYHLFAIVLIAHVYEHYVNMKILRD